MTVRILWGLLNIHRYDIIVVQKITLRRLSWWLKLNRQQIIYDLVDAPYTVHSKDHFEDPSGKDTPATALVEMLQLSRHVIVENTVNQKFAQQYCPHVDIILGPIDTQRYQPAPLKDEILTMGWIGSHDNTFYLLQIQDALETIAARHPEIVIKLIGAKKFASQAPNIRIIEWTLQTELTELATLDIGIMPLTDDAWAKSKGGYKILQYMALGIPVVASPVGVNEMLLKEPIGLVARSSADWVEKLEQLIHDKTLRDQMGQHARQLAETRYSLETSATRFIEILGI
jgi:glycosyltransferase involved in cell wall biosynthesis